MACPGDGPTPGKASGWLGCYGVRAPRSTDYWVTLYFLPLPAMVLLHFTKGFDHQLDSLDVALTGYIMPEVVFHVLINISGDLTTMDLQRELHVSAAVLAVCVLYGLRLVQQLRRRGPADALAGASERGHRHSTVSGQDTQNRPLSEPGDALLVCHVPRRRQRRLGRLTPVEFETINHGLLTA